MRAPEPEVAHYADLRGKVAVVTGGSKGIGAATCRQLVANGSRVAVIARDTEAIVRLVDDLTRSGGEAIGYSTDVTDARALDDLVGRVSSEMGPAEVLMAFAGGFFTPTPFLEITEEEFRNVVDWNLTSTFLTLKAFLPEMKGRGAGAVVTMSSCTGRFLDRTITASYAAAKAGVGMLTQHVAKEMATYGVRVNCIAPGTTLTERLEGTMTPERRTSVEAITPLGRLGVPEDLASAALFLASASSSWMTGVTLDVAGGRIML